jgi:hypothetical protein
MRWAAERLGSTPWERVVSASRHDFTTVEATTPSGRTIAGAFCVACQMFAPPGIYHRIAACEPTAKPETRPRPKVVT